MDINTKNSSGMMNGMPPAGKSDKKIGPIIGALIIILLIIIATLYFFNQRLNIKTQNESETNQIRNEASVSNSMDIESLESDLNAQLEDVDYSF